MGIIDAAKEKVGEAFDGAKNAAKAAVAPVSHLVENVGRKIGEVSDTLVNIFEGFLGSPIPDGGTNWNAYSHEDMRAMLHTDANPRQVGEQSEVLRTLGEAAHGCAHEVDREQHLKVPKIWGGEASNAFTRALGKHSSGGWILGDYTKSLSAAMETAADGLARAQREMPSPVNVSAAMADGAATGRLVGGHFGAQAGALGSLFGAGASGFTASLATANRKAEAVEVMQRFERRLYESAPPPPPRREELPPSLEDPVEEDRRPNPFGGGGSGAHGVRPSGTAATPGAVPSGMPDVRPGDSTNPNWAAPPGRTDSANIGPSVGPGSFAGNTSTVASGFVPAVGTGQDGRPAGGPVGWRDLVGSGSRSGVLSGTGSGVGGQPQVVTGPIRGGGSSAVSGNVSGNRGAPGYPGMAAPGGGGQRAEDKEHRNRMPRKEKLFTLDEKPSPPVRGA